MASQNKQKWIETGYHMVAETGFLNLNIESLARALEKSKSSFYHYFGDKAAFELDLLDYHLYRIELYAEKVRQCSNIRPEMIQVFLEHKTDLFFHKHLRFNRDNPEHKRCLEKAFMFYESAALDLWADFFGMPHNRIIVKLFMHFFTENFLLQISPENYTYDWFDNYVEDLARLLHQLQHAQG